MRTIHTVFVARGGLPGVVDVSDNEAWYVYDSIVRSRDCFHRNEIITSRATREEAESVARDYASEHGYAYPLSQLADSEEFEPIQEDWGTYEPISLEEAA